MGCEIEDFAETHICKLWRETPIARVTGWGVHVFKKDVGRRPPLIIASINGMYQGQQGDTRTFCAPSWFWIKSALKFIIGGMLSCVPYGNFM